MKSKLEIDNYGNKRWGLPNGDLHREDGPAFIQGDGGSIIWYLNGFIHRKDGPAIEYISGTKLWYINGKRHREDGPAIEYFSGAEDWYLNGIEYTKKQYKKKIRLIKLKSIL